MKKSEDDGEDGYKHFDSFHKKNGDKYGYEKHSSYGAYEHGQQGDGNEESGDEKQESKL